MIGLFQVIAISQSCGKGCDNLNDEANQKSLKELAELISHGAVLAISPKLKSAITEESNNSRTDLYQDRIKSLLGNFECGKLWTIEELPVFAMDGNNPSDFSKVTDVFIRDSELEESQQWKNWERDQKFIVNGKPIHVGLLSRGNVRKIKDEFDVGEPWVALADQLRLPTMWASRIKLVDPYFIRNSIETTKSGGTGALDLLLNLIIQSRKEIGTPLEELVIVAHSSPSSSSGYHNKRHAKSHFEEVVSSIPESKKYIKKIILKVHSKSLVKVESSLGEKRYLLFENDGAAIGFGSGVGIELNKKKKFKESIKFQLMKKIERRKLNTQIRKKSDTLVSIGDIEEN